MLEEISCQRLKATSASRRTQSEQNGEKPKIPSKGWISICLGKKSQAEAGSASAWEKNPKRGWISICLGKKSQAGLDQQLLGILCFCPFWQVGSWRLALVTISRWQLVFPTWT